ncbi:MAG: hypothetical protein AAGI08_01180 [Bacteroidota bacterium]
MLFIVGGLVVTGVAGYELSGRVSWTALIPAGFGILILALERAHQRWSQSRLLLWGLAFLSVLGIASTQRGWRAFATRMIEGRFDVPAVTISQTLMGALCLAVLAIVAGRIRRQGLEPTPPRRSP